MNRIWEIHRTFRTFFESYYPHIFVLSVIATIFIGYLHFELRQNSNDELDHWKNLLQFFNEMEALIILPFMLLITSVMLIFAIAVNLDSMRCYDELTHLQIKKRYSDYLFIQLVTHIELIEKKQLKHTKEMISIDNFIRAHEDMHKVIDKFRMDTKKLLALSEVEVLVPPEIIFADEEMHRTRFRHLSPEEDLVRELAAS